MPRLKRRYAFAMRLASVLMSSSLGLGVLSLGACGSADADAVHVDAPAVPGFADVVARVTPAVVSVRAIGETATDDDAQGFSFSEPGIFVGAHPLGRFFDDFIRAHDGRKNSPYARRGFGSGGRALAQGSGFFISPDGYVVTNGHLAEGATGFTVLTSDGSQYSARLIGGDRRTDLAVLKVDAKKPFTYVAFGDDSRMRVGDWILAVGNPNGLGDTVAAGIISSRGRDLGAGLNDDFIQIDAAETRGDSGGPAFNLSGEVIGVDTALFAPFGGSMGVSFAIPATSAKLIVEQLIAHGTVERGWIGIEAQSVTHDMADSLGLSDAHGAIVSRSEPNSPAIKAGIRAGDVILSVDNQPVADARALARRIAGIAPGSSADLTLWRDGKMQTVALDVAELPSEAPSGSQGAAKQPATTASRDFGLTLLPNDDGKGVLITDVRPGSEAEDKGLQPGDVILSVNNRPIASADDLRDAVLGASRLHRHAVLLEIEGESRTRFVALPVGAG